MKIGALFFAILFLQLGIVTPSRAAGQSENYTISAIVDCSGIRSHYVVRKVGQRLFESGADSHSGNAYLVNQTTPSSQPGVLSGKMSAVERHNSMYSTLSSEVTENSIVLRIDVGTVGQAPDTHGETNITITRASQACEISKRVGQGFSCHSVSCRFQMN
jgi:hypothetical protein